MKVYVMIPDEPLDRRSLFIVGKEADAKSLVECGMFYTYEVEEVFTFLLKGYELNPVDFPDTTS